MIRYFNLEWFLVFAVVQGDEVGTLSSRCGGRATAMLPQTRRVA